MEINEYLKDLSSNTNALLEIIEKYSNDEINFKKENECSISEILEHICISDCQTLELPKSESGKIVNDEYLYGNEKLKKIVVDYKGGPKITEIEIRELKGEVKDFITFKDIFLLEREELTRSLKNGDISLSNKIYKHLYLGDMTVKDWLIYIIYHTQRHLNDILNSYMEIKKTNL